MAIRLGSGKSSSGAGEDHDAEIIAEINTTPLTDIFLVLLIIFMVTSSVMSNTGVDVNLPSASSQTSQAQAEGTIISLLPQGKMQINGQSVDPGDYATLEASVKKAFTMTTSRLVILEGDKESFLGSAIEVMDTARRAGAEKFAIATATPK